MLSAASPYYGLLTIIKTVLNHTHNSHRNCTTVPVMQDWMQNRPLTTYCAVNNYRTIWNIADLFLAHDLKNGPRLASFRDHHLNLNNKMIIQCFSKILVNMIHTSTSYRSTTRSWNKQHNARPCARRNLNCHGLRNWDGHDRPAPRVGLCTIHLHRH